MSLSTETFSIFFLLALSACFSSLETALITLGDLRIRKRVEDGNRVSKMLKLWMENPNQVLATLLIGNNVINITISALATDMSHRALSGSSYAGWGIPIAVGVSTLFVLIAGEIIPKTYAKQSPNRVLLVLPLLTVAHYIFYPIMLLLVKLTSGILQRMGGAGDDLHTVTEDDIEELVRIGRTDGSISPVSTKLLMGIFELDDKVAREVMVPRTELRTLPGTATMEDVVSMVEKYGFSRYPVYEGDQDNVIGVLYVKDYMSHLMRSDKDSAPLVKELIRPPLVRPWNIGIHALLQDMQRERVHMAIIASEYGGVAGIVALEDIIEEVFGPIYDEHDPQKEALRRLPDGSWLASAVVTMSELGQTLGTDFPDNDDEHHYETVAGLVMQAAGRIPEKGFSCEHHGYSFEVKRANSLQVKEILIRPLSKESPLEGQEAKAKA